MRGCTMCPISPSAPPHATAGVWWWWGMGCVGVCCKPPQTTEREGCIPGRGRGRNGKKGQQAGGIHAAVCVAVVNDVNRTKEQGVRSQVKCSLSNHSSVFA
eukprot:TRINITY_DN1157_c2_g2_i1.p6 TRINITY_DN1157_c2_g2~~TRINITY_DN1157_c2_g2_i1.p6  ORF type:complete len:101 (+),score=5.07 TRINITY_DN1157_c2_g2_i1:1623-1925(+)